MNKHSFALQTVGEQSHVKLKRDTKPLSTEQVATEQLQMIVYYRETL